MLHKVTMTQHKIINFRGIYKNDPESEDKYAVYLLNIL